MRLLTDSGNAGMVARRLLPMALLVPLALSWFCAWGHYLGYFSIDLGVSIFSIATIVTFGVVIGDSARILQRSEGLAREADVRLKESLRRYRFLADAMPEITWTAKPDGSVDYTNRRWSEYTRLPTEAAQGWGWQEVLHPDDLQRALDRWAQSVRTGSVYEIEYRFKRASDGAYRWHLGRATPLRNEKGEIIQWVGTCTDIDDLKRARMELEARVAERTRDLVSAREGLQAVLDAATQVAIIATDTEGVITVFNRGAEQMFGYTPEELIGKKTTAIFHVEEEVIARGRELSAELGQTVEGFDVFVEKARRGEREAREWTYVRKNGTRLPVNLMITASRDGDGAITGYLGIATDITARNRTEKALRDQALILDLANDSIFIRTIEGKILYWNQGAQRLYGWSSDEAVGRLKFELLKTKFPMPLEEIVARLKDAGHWEGELVQTRRDGTTVIVASSWTLQRDEKQTPVSVIEMNYDITARKKTERELQTSRERLNTILYSSLDGVIVYEAVRNAAGDLRDLRFALINPAAEKLMRQNASQLIGHTLVEKFPEATTSGLFQKLAAIVEGAGNREFDYVSHREGKTRWYRIAAVKMSDGLVISYTEITARKEHERQLHEAKERAELADQSKSSFLANMSHEIRTPMNGVIGMTGLLLDTRLDTEQRNLAETIRNSGESLLNLINDILDFSKVEAGHLSFEEINFDLRKVLEDTLELLAGQALAKNIELAGGLAPGTPSSLRGDPARLQQVLTNLIGNAIKFTKTGEVTARVSHVGEIDDLPALIAASSVVAFPVDDLYGKVDVPTRATRGARPGRSARSRARAGRSRTITTARFVDPGDAVALATELAALLTNKEDARALGDRGKELYASRFTPHVVAAQYDDLYDQMSQETP